MNGEGGGGSQASISDNRVIIHDRHMIPGRVQRMIPATINLFTDLLTDLFNGWLNGWMDGCMDRCILDPYETL